VCSGQIGIEQGVGGPALVEGGFEAQARKALANVSALLWGRNVGWAHVVKTSVFLADMADYGAFNAIYTEVLGEHRPARSVVAVAGLPLGALVEIEAWAYGGDEPLR
jgi:2-iminobutanoate/2-iminopropanoate deaminase